MKAEEILEDSEILIAESSWSIVIDNEDELNEVFAILKEVYKVKPFDILEFRVIWE